MSFETKGKHGARVALGVKGDTPPQTKQPMVRAASFGRRAARPVAPPALVGGYAVGDKVLFTP